MGTVFDGEWNERTVGIIPRALNDIFATARSIENEQIVRISCSFMELYQEEVFDLLSNKARNESKCDIREDNTKGIVVAGLSEKVVGDIKEAFECLIKGGRYRSIGSTAMNDVSSRSHAIFTVNISLTSLEDDTKKNAKFHLVDLAGSERSKKTQATGTRFKEGVKINQGLLALGNVISALGGGSVSSYISYRDSRLTRLLQDSLGGNSVTLMMACVSPADYNIEETLGTLRYADRAKKIKNKPVKNEDSHSLEVARLKKIIQDLRVQLLGTGAADPSTDMPPPSRPNGEGSRPLTLAEKHRVIDLSGVPPCDPTYCNRSCYPAYLKIKEERDKLKAQLTVIIISMNELSNLHLLEEGFINDLLAAFESFSSKILSTCSAEFAMPDTKIFEEIRQQAEEINEMIRKYKAQIDELPTDKIPEEPPKLFDASEEKKYADYTNNQLMLFTQISNLDRNMKIKQQLLDRKNENVPILDETADKSMAEYEETIKALEKELEELRSEKASVTMRRDTNATKVNMDRKHKIEKLEKDLTELRKKIVTLEKQKKIAEQDRKRIEDLRREIEEMKKAKVHLIRTQRSEADKYKRFIATRDKEINFLKEKGRKAQNEMKRKERLHEKQQAVLKRKVEEAKAISKRLQDTVDRNRKIQKEHLDKTTTKRANIVQDYIDHEICVIHSSIDAKNTMQSLMNDRGLLMSRLQNLKATVQKTPSIETEISQLEEDLEMRSAQISDMRGHLAETDVEAKLKNIPENFATVPELRIAMSYVLRALAEAREMFNTNKMKTDELKAAYEASEERVEFLVEENAEIQKLVDEEKEKMERDFEQKITLICQKQKGGLSKGEEEKCFVELTDQLTAKFEEIAQLKLRIQELENKNEKPEKPKSAAKKTTRNETFEIDSGSDVESVDMSDDDDDVFNMDDSFTDPDWKKTPRPKRATRATATLMKESIVNRLDGTGMLNNISEASDTSESSYGVKRSSTGATKCSCRGSCATKVCGCVKSGSHCSKSCKCSELACVNQINVSKRNNSAANETTSMQENLPENSRTSVEVTPEKASTR